ncbi:NAD(P)/FAD-dependent oxidoreductase [Erythrobacter sp. LQ02-29]|uniref:NAD(P)/FAD-dependent oxidoreductase n=1 Tax=Erythrobacter sp. LQ02-29 TaxID=2920384 RepID=UPI001F4ED3BF|nr:NAD(P)/FAD-dependent oxidoreductase [Erythrobacter sp. LQ02-29]MCP9222977.1 NAD(P)/FAD-dependent oxidoreductase [Erythrobacter sp. LQ02-29]
MDDCIIIGAGPAGLTAAIYLARFYLKVRLFDCGTSRAALIPRTHNHAGYPDGITGTDLLDRMRRQAARFGAVREERRVIALAHEDGHFRIETHRESFAARSVLLATGVFNRHPPGMDDTLHDEALARGLLRYCPICDGYEVTDKRVGVIGTGDHGTREALFLRGYTADVTLVAPDVDHELDEECQAELAEAGIETHDGPCGEYRIEGDRLAVETADGWLQFDSVYPALGSHIRSELAVNLGAEATEEGCLTVDDHLETTVPGLFAAGDVVLGLDQISHAMGQAGVAATTIRNHLAQERPLRR